MLKNKRAVASGLALIGALSLVASACGSKKKAADTTVAAAPDTTVAAATDTTVPAATDTTVVAAADTTVAAAAASATTVAAAGATTTVAGAAAAAGAGGKVGVILPDSKSSVRWETADRPFLEAAFKEAGVQYDIQNAEGDAAKMQTIADGMIAGGVKVLAIVNLDSDSGAAIEKKAADAGVKTIDYDRLTLKGSASAYVSFDNVKVGQLQGEGLLKCLADKKVNPASIIELHGAPTDNNATLFKQGYQTAIKAAVDSGAIKVVGEEAVPGWDNVKGGQIFEQLLTKAGGKIDGVLAANDGLGGAAIAVLKKNSLQVPVTGQDASVDGLKAVLAGDQCMTVYKAVKVQAAAAAAAAISLLKGEAPDTKGQVVNDGVRDVPAVLATPVAIYKANVKDVITDGYQTKADVCTADLAAACTAAGIA